MRLSAYLPIAQWLPNYRAAELPSDLVAGVITGIVLVPQAMAYAALAGLPPQVGMYACLLPLLIYSVLGSSRTMAVGPVAIVSLMVASALGDVAAQDSAQYLQAALALALMSGAMLVAMGLARLGFLVNFLSHPVISGFTSAAALMIGFSQVRHLLGLEVPRTHSFLSQLEVLIPALPGLDLRTASIGLGCLALLVVWRGPLRKRLLGAGCSEAVVLPIANAAPFVAVLVATLGVWALGLADGGRLAIVGALPEGLPSLSVPDLDPAMWQALLPSAALIAAIGFLESVSVARALAARRRQKIDPDQELLALGAANIGAAFTGGYAVAGGFGRSVVNFTAGALTPLASMVTALLLALTLAFLTPLFYFLPKAALAAVIIVAVTGLVDLRTLRESWGYNRADAVCLLVTFASVLLAGVEAGIAAGVLLSIALYLFRTSRPHIAVVGRVPGTEHFRNVTRHEVQLSPEVLAIRVDESLYFANTAGVEDFVLRAVSESESVRHVVLIMSAVNFIDASALETLEELLSRLRDSGAQLHLAEVKGPVMDRLQHTLLLEELAPGQVFLSTHDALKSLAP